MLLAPVFDGEISDFELDLAAIIPFIDGGVEDDRDVRAGHERMTALGHVPGDRFHDHIVLSKPELKVVLLVTDDSGC